MEVVEVVEVVAVVEPRAAGHAPPLSSVAIVCPWKLTSTNGCRGFAPSPPRTGRSTADCTSTSIFRGTSADPGCAWRSRRRGSSLRRGAQSLNRKAKSRSRGSTEAHANR